MTGTEFEVALCKHLKAAGYWTHRIAPNATGQQPFDIIAIKGNRVCAYDAKVVSEGHRFVMERLEDNQLNAFRLMQRKTAAEEIGLLIACEGRIYFMPLHKIETAIAMGKKSIDVTSELDAWRAL